LNAVAGDFSFILKKMLERLAAHALFRPQFGVHAAL
jgi:hypothetical protein